MQTETIESYTEELKTEELKITAELPENHRPYTDKYFLRTNEILKKEKINPTVSMNVFARGEGKIAGLDDAIRILEKYSTIRQAKGEVWVTTEDYFHNKDTLMIIRSPIQSFVELETMYLGVLSDAISNAAGLKRPTYDQVKEKFSRLKEIYKDIPITYFGARHYHWSLDEQIAKAALEAGAVQTSTDIGSSNIGKEGVGTTPHALTLALASMYGKDNATLMTAMLFDKHMDKKIPRSTLIDTFNKEITDALSVAKYFGQRQHSFRIDTCGENIGEGGVSYPVNNGRDPTYQTGTGVTIRTVTSLRNALIENGYGKNTGIILSSGFGDEEKAKAFMKANEFYKNKTGFDLFSSVGIGEVSKTIFTTADIFQIDQWPMYKTGRPIGPIDYKKFERVI